VEVLDEFELPLKLLVGVKISTDLVVLLVSKSSVSVPDGAFDGDGASDVGDCTGDGALGANIVMFVVFGDTMEGVVETV